MGGPAPEHAAALAPPPAPLGPDGLMQDLPTITFAEQVIAEKEALLRKYIQSNYSQIKDVERELEGLALEVKLTAGSRRQALELLRRKIEAQAERIKAAKAKEDAAKKAWEAMQKVVQELEVAKNKLCEDLNLMIQESAQAQVTRLEALTQKLDALNPTKAVVPPMAAATGSNGKPTDGLPQAQVVDRSGSNGAMAAASSGQDASASGSVPSAPDAAGPPSAAKASPAPAPAAVPAAAIHMGAVRGRGRGGGRSAGGRGGAMSLRPARASGDANGAWTGAGFDVAEAGS